MEKKFKVYCLRDVNDKIVYIGATRRTLHRRFLTGYKCFDHRNYKIQLIDSFDTPEEMFELESNLIKHYGIQNLLNKIETTTAGFNPKGLSHNGTFKKGTNGDDRFGDKRKEAAFEARARTIKCITNNKIYKSISEASRELNVLTGNINKVLKGLRTHTGGYKFEYVNQANTEG